MVDSGAEYLKSELSKTVCLGADPLDSVFTFGSQLIGSVSLGESFHLPVSQFTHLYEVSAIVSVTFRVCVFNE